MNKIDLKNKIFIACRDTQLSKINSLQDVVDDAQKSANEYGGPKDRYDSYRAQLLRKRDMFAQQLAHAKKQLDILLRINPEILLDKVEFGSVIFTDKQNLFISISLGKFDVDGKQFYAISPKVPIFKALKDRTMGDKIAFNDQILTIESVF